LPATVTPDGLGGRGWGGGLRNPPGSRPEGEVRIKFRASPNFFSDQLKAKDQKRKLMKVSKNKMCGKKAIKKTVEVDLMLTSFIKKLKADR
jgi:hypothetical protein